MILNRERTVHIDGIRHVGENVVNVGKKIVGEVVVVEVSNNTQKLR